jgi:hypothetical protein
MGTLLLPTERNFATPLPEGRADCRKPALPRRCALPLPTPTALRVTRVLEDTRQSGQAGRMVISGRMADVCAELERLARLEAHY